MQITTTEVDEEINVNPALNFFFALKAPESKRQYPKRFEKFLDYLKLEGTFEDKALSFYKKAIENPQWLTNKLVEFAQYQKQRALRGEISESTIPNYFKAVKLFCVMNDIIVNWQKLNKGIPRFYVLDGELTFNVEGKQVISKAGTMINIPPNVIHSFKNHTDSIVRVLIIIAPAGMEKLFEEVGTEVSDMNIAKTSSPSDEEKKRLVEVSKRYGVEIIV